MSGPPPSTCQASGATKKITTTTPLNTRSPAFLSLAHNFNPPTPPRIPQASRYANMSEGEIEVEAVTGYEVLPKEYIQELGSTKLFSTSNRSRRIEARPAGIGC